jgi:DNA mismatch repair protein MutS2
MRDHTVKEMGKDRDTEQSTATDSNALRAKSLELLDFNTIRDLVAERAVFPAARELALGMTPSYASHAVEALQRETTEGRVFLEVAGDVSLRVSEDASPAVERAALEGTLTGLQLLAVADSLDVLRRARSAVLRVRDAVTLLARIADGIPDLHEVQRRITTSIGSRGEVLDSATPILGDLRRQARDAYGRVTEALERIIHSPLGRDVLQDQVVSLRGDRLVLQVKTEMRKRVPGIVLDASNTGATLFIEPFATVDLCNAWRELALEEDRETRRVLLDLSALVGAVAPDINRGVDLTARLDFILARARYGATLGGVAARAPAGSSEGTPGGPSMRVRLLRARHPLLGEKAVPISVHIGPGWTVLVITGPNTGGKTVAMKTLGLLGLMHQSGLQIPAEEGSSLPVFDGIYADVGDQQSIQQSVSTFGSHMRGVIDILSHATTASLVLLDELGTSTDPEEGSALAKAILGHLASRGIMAVATTHHRTVAAHAEATPRMMNASVDLDPATLRPTYLLTLGVPGRSYAMSVAAKLGLPDHIMEAARSLLEPQHTRFEDWLNELHHDRQQLKSRLQEADETQARAEAVRRDLDARLEDLASRRGEILHGIRRELEGRFDEVRRRLRRAEGALSWSPLAREAVATNEVEKAGIEIAGAKQEMEALERRAPEAPHGPERPSPSVGDLVEVRGLDVQGTVVAISEQDMEAEVAVGDVRFRLDIHRLSPAREREKREPGGTEVQYELAPGPPTLELDLRGYRAEDALLKVEEFLDKALRHGLSSVRIIHGKGTGALRRAVREMLADHPLARSFAPEAHERGGDGVTVVELV